VPRSLTSTARATAARLHLLELPPPGRDYVAFLNTLRGHVEGEGEGGTEESGEGPRKALWVAAGKRRQGERKGRFVCDYFPRAARTGEEGGRERGREGRRML
jgi:hypothetical protein